VLVKVPPYKNIVNLCQDITADDQSVLIFVTARRNKFYDLTAKWLEDHIGNRKWQLVCKADHLPIGSSLAVKLAAVSNIVEQIKPDKVSIYENELDILEAHHTMFAEKYEAEIYQLKWSYL